MEKIETTIIAIDFWELLGIPGIPSVTIEFPEYIKCLSLNVFGFRTKEEK